MSYTILNTLAKNISLSMRELNHPYAKNITPKVSLSATKKTIKVSLEFELPFPKRLVRLRKKNKLVKANVKVMTKQTEPKASSLQLLINQTIADYQQKNQDGSHLFEVTPYAFDDLLVKPKKAALAPKDSL